MIAVDTNVLVRYLVGDDAEQASHCSRSQACGLNRLEKTLQQVARHHHAPRGRSTWNPVLNTMKSSSGIRTPAAPAMTALRSP